MQSATTIIAVGGQPDALDALDAADAANKTRMIVGSNTLRTRRVPINWAVICLIDQIQRAHMAAREAQARADARA